jgi:hypothetical protein
MPPDTTLNTALSLKVFLDHLDTILSIIGGGGLLGLLAKLFSWLKRWLDRRALRQGLGATPYSSQDIKRATRHYVRPQCQSLDPAQGQEIRTVYASREDLFSAVDRLLNEPTESKYLILLADSGMGKTSFVLNYYARHLRRLRRRFDMQVVPLGFKDADKLIRKMIDDKAEAARDTVLFLDALDEDTLAIVDHRERLFNLCEATAAFRNVLITCRTQFFPRAVEEPGRTGVVKITPIRPGEEGEHLFHKLYLSPFNDGQVKKYLRRRYSIWRWLKRRRARKVAGKIPQLTARPMLLAHIDDLLAKDRDYAYPFQLYEEMVEAWLTREEGRVEGLRKEPLREFSERLAVELFTQRQQQGGERLPHDEIEPLAQKFGIKLEAWKLTGRSLLNRDAEDNFKFAHRSIMEYLFVKRFLALPMAERPKLVWTNQQRLFLQEIVRLHWGTEYKMTLNLRHAALSIFADLRNEPIFQLRAHPTTLSSDAVNNMLEKYNFFDSTKSETGKGITHLYEKFGSEAQKFVIDYATGLNWQQSGSPEVMNYVMAEKYIFTLNSKRFSGYSDWRLPTLEEVMSLMERQKSYSGLFIYSAFDYRQRWIWTVDKESAEQVWCVNFDSGGCYFCEAYHESFVRAVRSR